MAPGENCSSMPDMLLWSKRKLTDDEDSSSLGDSEDDAFYDMPRGRLPHRTAPPQSPRREPSRGCLAPWARSLSDTVMLQPARRNEEALARNAFSMPAVLPKRPAAPPPEPGRAPVRGLSLSQARLIIPRSISEYVECCRFARPHSEGLLWVATVQSGVLATCRDMVPRALSEGLLGGRLFAYPQSRGRQPISDEKPAPKPRIPVGKLQTGTVMEGRIAGAAAIGLFVDVGAKRQGLLRWRDCKGVPRALLRRDEVLSNLVVVRVWPKKRRFALRVEGVGVDDENLEEEAYGAILKRIAGWAGVKMPEDAVVEEKPATPPPEESPRRRKGRRRPLAQASPSNENEEEAAFRQSRSLRGGGQVKKWRRRITPTEAVQD